jgi:hypothetical protein
MDGDLSRYATRVRATVRVPIQPRQLGGELGGEVLLGRVDEGWRRVGRAGGLGLQRGAILLQARVNAGEHAVAVDKHGWRSQ